MGTSNAEQCRNWYQRNIIYARKKNNEYWWSNRARYMRLKAVSRARRFGWACDLSDTFVEKLLSDMKCRCCRRKLRFAKKKARVDSPSLDRINSALGYTEKNTTLLCRRCNIVKNDGTAADHKRIANWMSAEGKRRKLRV